MILWPTASSVLHGYNHQKSVKNWSSDDIDGIPNDALLIYRHNIVHLVLKFINFGVLTWCKYNYPRRTAATMRPPPIEKALNSELVSVLAVRLHYCCVSTRYGCLVLIISAASFGVWCMCMRVTINWSVSYNLVVRRRPDDWRKKRRDTWIPYSMGLAHSCRVIVFNSRPITAKPPS